jgi:hypothetical protein
VDLLKKLKSTDYATLVAEEKWSEQLKGLQLVIDAIGPVPKVKPSTEVADLVAVLKGFLRAGHLQVQVASLKILALLADGMRAPFGSTLRPVLQQVVGKCKEKRLVPEVQAVLQAAFTHCLHYDCVNDDVIEFVGSKKSPPHGKVRVVCTVCSGVDQLFEVTLCVPTVYTAIAHDTFSASHQLSCNALTCESCTSGGPDGDRGSHLRHTPRQGGHRLPEASGDHAGGRDGGPRPQGARGGHLRPGGDRHAGQGPGQAGCGRLEGGGRDGDLAAQDLQARTGDDGVRRRPCCGYW